MANAGGISIHAIDVSRGIPAAGLFVALYQLKGPEKRLIADGHCGEDGAFSHSVNTGEGIGIGVYEAMFGIGSYYRAQGIMIPTTPFLDDTPFRFGIASIEQHYHLPLKFTPWGFSLFRGGA